MIDFITSIISDLGKWLGDLSISDILSGLVGIIPRTIVFVRLLFMPLYNLFDNAFGLYTALLFVAVITFISFLAVRRGVSK